MILHTVNKPAAWVKCSDLIGPHDEIVLREDGVYLALTKIKKASAIRADIEARGLTHLLPSGIELIDYPNFVKLCCHSEKICAWF